jgi:predicted metal-dependent phosphotriesterase family hydrolase
LADRTGVRIVASTGHVSEEYWRDVLDLDRRSEDQLAAEYVTDLSDRAGIVKAGTSLDGPTKAEEKLLRAAARAQRETGAPITTHTTAGTGALEQADVLAAADADLTHVCDLDRLLDADLHFELAWRGVFLGYDCISKEQYAPDAERVRFICRLVEAGYGRQVLVSGDLARRSYLEAWGGSPGYRHVLEDFVPQLRAAALDEDAVQALLVDNPAPFLAWL